MQKAIHRTRQHLQDTPKAYSTLYRTFVSDTDFLKDAEGRDAEMGLAFQQAVQLIESSQKLRRVIRFKTTETLKHVFGTTKVAPPMELQDLTYKLVNGNLQNLRSLCITTDGQLCLTSQETRPGDLVVAFVGCGNLYVLHPTTDKEFIFLGTTWIDGIMDEEFMASEGWREKLEEFTLV